MTSRISFQLTNRSKKTPIRKLPTSLELPGDATVEDAKKSIARQTGIRDYNRIGLFDPATSSTFKDRQAPLKGLRAVQAGEVQVKDLGPQMSWRAVYVVEYFGPILFHALLPLLRQYIYIFYPYDLPEGKVPPLKTVQWILLVFFQLHFLKRELETLFLHKFSANTMPARKIFWNSAFYWGLAGLCGGYDIYAPRSFAARDTLGPLDYLGLAMIVYGEVCTFIVHVHLAGLRRPGTTERGIPTCIGSSLVTCPNYMFEVIAWVGVMLMCRSWGVAAFMWVGIAHMRDWSKGKERTLRQMFPDKYKPHKYTMLPGLI